MTSFTTHTNKIIIMKKSIKLLSLALVIATGVMACKKDKTVEEKKEPQLQPQILKLKSLTFKGEIRVYTKDGEITDPAIIAKAIVSTGMNIITHTVNEKIPVASFLDQSTFKMAPLTYSFKKNEDQFLFTLPSTMNIQTNDLNIIAAPFVKHTGLGKVNSDGTTAYNKQFVAYGNQDEIKLSAVDICHLRKFDNTPRTESWWLESCLNEFFFKGI
jgi:hypothetical protein